MEDDRTNSTCRDSSFGAHSKSIQPTIFSRCRWRSLHTGGSSRQTFFYAVLPALFLGPWLVLVGGGTLLHPPCSGVGPLRKAVAHGRLRMDTFHFTRSRLGLSDDEMGRRS